MAVPPHGHWWTIAPNLLGRLRAAPASDVPWSTSVSDPQSRAELSPRRFAAELSPRRFAAEKVMLAGALGGPRSDELFLLVHGLGGDADSPYMIEAASELQAHGYATLRISMRGAGRSGADYFHAGLAADLLAVLADPSLAAYRRIIVLGFSLGGHVGMHLSFMAAQLRDPRVAAIIAICSPLDLEHNVIALDGPSSWIYRRYVLNGLAKIYAKLHPGQARRFTTIREWDSATIVPRYGFGTPEQYWRSQSAGPRLREARLPILYVGCEADPMVPAATVSPHLQRAGSTIDIRWVRRGGHVGFPRDIDLGLPGELGLIPQVLSWTTRKL